MGFPFFYQKTVLKDIFDLLTLLIGAEGTRLLENAIAFSSCVGGLEEAFQCPAGYRGHWRPHRRQSAEEAPGPPRGKRVPGA